MQNVQCPYCGEHYESSIDVSGGNQEYFEDCQVCCHPIAFLTRVNDDGNLLTIEIRRDDD
ncbi:MAG: CPXCG motif-containing cysteine-rich protein [Gammaproteobacteria bacterium]|nr:MAG: CPXCG motif-containing cysteine-rich protein [Gammaproteobacteria bacterium]